jgi:hypothetical protein
LGNTALDVAVVCNVPTEAEPASVDKKLGRNHRGTGAEQRRILLTTYGVITASDLKATVQPTLEMLYT